MRSRIRSLLIATALAAPAIAGVTAAGSAQAAAAPSLCDSSRYCITAQSFSPSTVVNTQDTKVTVTIKAPRGHRCLDSYGRVDQLGTDAGHMLMQFNETSWYSGTYTGTFTVLAGAKPGRLPFDTLSDCGGGGSFVSDQIAASGLTLLNVTGTQDVTAPAPTAITLSATTVDVTAGPVSVPITVHAKDPAGVDRIQATFRPNGAGGYSRVRSTLSTISTGTLRDGDFTGSVTFPQGAKAAWALELITFDRFGNQLSYSNTDLATAHLPNTVTTTSRT